MTALEFIKILNEMNQEYAGSIPKKEIFSLAKKFEHMPVSEAIILLKDQYYDHRLGAVSILDWKARNKNTSIKEKFDCYSAYLENHKWIDDWGLVDRAAPYVVGGYLIDKDKKALYDLAISNNPMERRTAIVSTYYFIRKDMLEDTFKIAEILVADNNEYVQKAVGSWIREAGKRDRDRLEDFLNKFAPILPRITLRYAIEKLDQKTRKHYLELGKIKN